MSDVWPSLIGMLSTSQMSELVKSIDTNYRARTREKMLERELAKLVGDNWQVRLV